MNKAKYEAGIQLLEDAGFEVKVLHKTFSVWKGGKKLYGFSNYKWLADHVFIIDNVIRNYAYATGYRDGQQNIKRRFKELMEV